MAAGFSWAFRKPGIEKFPGEVMLWIAAIEQAVKDAARHPGTGKGSGVLRELHLPGRELAEAAPGGGQGGVPASQPPAKCDSPAELTGHADLRRATISC